VRRRGGERSSSYRLPIDFIATGKGAGAVLKDFKEKVLKDGDIKMMQPKSDGSGFEIVTL
jgi:hypothetical protein